VAVSVAALPALSSLAGEERRGEFKQALSSTLNLILFINLPAAAGLAGLAWPLVDVLFGRGEFSGPAVHGTALALLGYVAGLPAFSCVRSLVSAYYALGDTKTPVRTAVICLVAYVIMGGISMQFVGHVGLALASSVSAWINVSVLGFLLRRTCGTWFSVDRDLVLSLILSAGLFVGCWASSGLGWISLLFIPLWAAAYMGCSLLLGSSQARLLADALGRRLKGA
jgi:putative peptidoglycan lipid II flippase